MCDFEAASGPGCKQGRELEVALPPQLGLAISVKVKGKYGGPSLLAKISQQMEGRKRSEEMASGCNSHLLQLWPKYT